MQEFKQCHPALGSTVFHFGFILRLHVATRQLLTTRPLSFMAHVPGPSLYQSLWPRKVNTRLTLASAWPLHHLTSCHPVLPLAHSVSDTSASSLPLRRIGHASGHVCTLFPLPGAPPPGSLGVSLPPLLQVSLCSNVTFPMRSTDLKIEQTLTAPPSHILMLPVPGSPLIFSIIK